MKLKQILVGSVVALVPALPLTAAPAPQQAGADAKAMLTCGDPTRVGGLNVKIVAYTAPPTIRRIGEVQAHASTTKEMDGAGKAQAIADALNAALPGSSLAGQVEVAAALGVVVASGSSGSSVGKLRINVEDDTSGEDSTASSSDPAPQDGGVGIGGNPVTGSLPARAPLVLFHLSGVASGLDPQGERSQIVIGAGGLEVGIRPQAGTPASNILSGLWALWRTQYGPTASLMSGAVQIAGDDPVRLWCTDTGLAAGFEHQP